MESKGKVKKIVTFTYRQRAGKWIVRGKDTAGNWHEHRTTVPASAPTLDDEPPDIRAAVLSEQCVWLQDRIDNVRPTGCKYTYWNEATMDYLNWYFQNHKDKARKYCLQPFIKEFGEQRIRKLDSVTASAWAEKLSNDCASWHNFRLKVTAAQAMITWLKNSGQWNIDNPFDGLAARHRHKFPALPPVRGHISDSEYDRLLHHADTTVRLFIEISRSTGLRPSEVRNLELSNLDKQELVWNVLVSKTSGQQYYRRIAIPARLISILSREGAFTNGLSLKGFREKFERTREAASLPHIQQKMFRKDFATRMRRVGASHSHITFQQGRRGDVTSDYYFDEEQTLDEVRQYIERLFDTGQPTPLRRVK